MSLNLVAILVSLAMMLTGAGGEGQPAELSRTLVVRDITVNVDGHSVQLAPSLRLGASTDGQKAVFDVGVDLEGDTLFPIQIGASENGVTAVLSGSDLAVSVSAGALDALLQGIQSDETGETDSAGMISVLVDEFIPAYTELLSKAMDASFMEQVSADIRKLVEEQVDRGEGKPVTVEIDGQQQALTEYSYTVETEQLAQLMDAVYTSNELFANYYNAMFRLYAVMPKEAGISGITSYAEMFEKMGIGMTLNITEQVSEDGNICLTDAIMTMDMSGMAAAMGMDEASVPAEPLIMNIHGRHVGAYTVSDIDTYIHDEQADMSMAMRLSMDENSSMADCMMNMYEEGGESGSIHLSASQIAGASGVTHTGVSFDMDMDNAGYYSFACMGQSFPDGTGESRVSFIGNNGSQSFGLSFIAEVTAEAIQDIANGHEAALVIDDLSADALNALMTDEAASTLLQQAMAALSSDAMRLMSDPSVQELTALSSAPTAEDDVVEDAKTEDDAVETIPLETEEPAIDEASASTEAIPDPVDEAPEDELPMEIDLSEAKENGDEVDIPQEFELVVGENGDYTIEGLDGIDGMSGMDYLEGDLESIEDDGELGFNIPVIGWLPAGWSVAETNTDTAYDWVEMYVNDENGDNCAYMIFFPDIDVGQTDYILSDNGSMTPQEGCVVSITDMALMNDGAEEDGFDMNGLFVVFSKSGVCANMQFNTDTVDTEIIGKIAAGIQY